MALPRDAFIDDEIPPVEISGTVPVSIAAAVQVGNNPPALSLYRLLASAAGIYGVTFFDAAGAQVGAATTLTIAAAPGTAVGLASVASGSIPAGAVTAAFALPTGVTALASLYYTVSTDNAIVTDFQTNYIRYRRKLLTTAGTTLGA